MMVVNFAMPLADAMAKNDGSNRAASGRLIRELYRRNDRAIAKDFPASASRAPRDLQFEYLTIRSERNFLAFVAN